MFGVFPAARQPYGRPPGAPAATRSFRYFLIPPPAFAPPATWPVGHCWGRITAVFPLPLRQFGENRSSCSPRGRFSGDARDPSDAGAGAD
jgi:hypothetical protein